MNKRQGCSREVAALFGQEVSKLSSASGSARILVVGPEHIELIIELANRGFFDVCCRSLTGPNAGELSADIVIAPAMDCEPKLLAFVTSLERTLQPNGILLLGTTTSFPTVQTRFLQKHLRQSGFIVARAHWASAALSPFTVVKSQRAREKPRPKRARSRFRRWMFRHDYHSNPEILQLR